MSVSFDPQTTLEYTYDYYDGFSTAYDFVEFYTSAAATSKVAGTGKYSGCATAGCTSSAGSAWAAGSYPGVGAIPAISVPNPVWVKFYSDIAAGVGWGYGIFTSGATPPATSATCSGVCTSSRSAVLASRAGTRRERASSPRSMSSL